MEQSDRSEARRTSHACAACRRRKTKCDGARPRCRHCTAKRIACIWPSFVTAASEETSVISLDLTKSPTAAARSSHSTPWTMPNRDTLRRLFDHFFKRHFANDFCSFFFVRDFEEDYEQSSFLVASILTLCARYLTRDEALEDFGLDSGSDVWMHFVPVARFMAKSSSDEPSVSNIHGNLVLALAELLSNSGSRHWMYAGTAIRMAQMMLLNKEYHLNHSLQEREIRRRTLWACLLFDRKLAYFIGRPRTFSLDEIEIALPSSDRSVDYQEDTRGLTLENLPAFSGYPSDIGISPYFIKTVCIWSDMADIDVGHRRFKEKIPPTDSRSHFARCTQAMQEWSASLPTSLRWTAQNYQNQRRLGQSRNFVAMHMLIYGSLCVAHQTYLPQLDGSSMLLDAIDAAGWLLLHREPALISTCVSNALAIGELVVFLREIGGEDGVATLQSTWIVASIMPAMNAFLWIQYARDPDYSTESTIARAQLYFKTVHSTIKSWIPQWKVARKWIAILDSTQATYRAAYLGEIPETLSRDEDTLDSLDEDGQNDYRPTPGDGSLSEIGMPYLYFAIRLIMTGSTVKHETLHSLWRALASGWSQRLNNGLVLDPASVGTIEPRW